MTIPLTVLRILAKSKRERLEPQPDAACPGGFGFPDVRAALAVQAGNEVAALDALAEGGHLEREFYQETRVCPACAAGVLSLRVVCPRCAGLQVVGDAAGGYRCASCREAFAQPALRCLCLVCGRPFAAEKAAARLLYAYRLTEKGARAAAEAEPQAPPPPFSGVAEGEVPSAATVPPALAADFPGVFLDTERAVYTLHFFEERIAQEVARARRYRRSFSVMMASPHNTEAYAAAFGREAAASLLKAVAVAIKESLRDSDIPALHESRSLAFLLPETPFDGARTVAERIRNRVLVLNPPARDPKITLAMGVAAYSEGVACARDMIDAAVRHLESARQAGGNCVHPSRS